MCSLVVGRYRRIVVNLRFVAIPLVRPKAVDKTKALAGGCHLSARRGDGRNVFEMRAPSAKRDRRQFCLIRAGPAHGVSTASRRARPWGVWALVLAAGLDFAPALFRRRSDP
jgi:hypothetical protein